MPMPDAMGIAFTPTEITDLTTHFTAILTIMNAKKIVQLSDEERQAAQSVSEIRFPYVQNAIENLAPTFPNLQPNFMSLTDAHANLNATNTLRTLDTLRNEVNDRMIDFAIASEHFAYMYLRELYEVAKRAQAANTPGADVVVATLAPLFEGQGQHPPVVPTP